jgi:hypothetical protein
LLGHTNSQVIIIIIIIICAIHAIEVIKLQIKQKIFNTPDLLLQKSTEHIHVNLPSASQEEEYQWELPVQKTSTSLQSLSPPEICLMPQHQQNKPTAYTGL